MQFSSAVTYNMFVTLGLITAVPVSGGNKLNNSLLAQKYKFSIICFLFNFSSIFPLHFANPLTYCIFLSLDSLGRDSIWRHFCWNEIGRCHSNRYRLLSGHVSRELARLYNAFIKVPSHSFIHLLNTHLVFVFVQFYSLFIHL